MQEAQVKKNKNIENKELKSLQKTEEEKKRLLKEIKVLNNKIEFLQNPLHNKNLGIVINKLTEEIQYKNECTSKNLEEIKFKDKTILGFQKNILFRDKEIKLLKQTIKDINKKYNDSEEMYEQVQKTLEECLKDNDKLKLDLIEKKKPTVFEYRLLGFCIFSKTSF